MTSLEVVKFLDKMLNICLTRTAARWSYEFPFCQYSLATPILKMFEYENCAKPNNEILYLTELVTYSAVKY